MNDLPDSAAQLVVSNTEQALEALGQAARARTGARIIGVTGSVGKTGVKEALLTVLGRQAATSATKGNLNNQWGLPLSLARMHKETEFGVLELGMNHPGELGPLSKMARPHVAVVTTVASVHSAFFADETEIAKAKAEIFEGLEPGGSAVLNRDNPHFETLRLAALAAGAQRIIDFGTHADARCKVLSSRTVGDQTEIAAEILGTQFHYRIGIPGPHWILNSAAVLATVAAIGADIEQAADDLADLRPTGGRGRRHEISLINGSMILVDESYNASPVSMAAALKTLGATQPALGGRRIAVLGDMLELGDRAADQHAGLASDVAGAGVDLVLTAGPLMKHLFDNLPQRLRVFHGADSKAVLGPLIELIKPGDIVMVKGSAGSRMGAVVEELLKCSQAAGRVVNGN